MAAKKKDRVSLRANRVTIDDKMLGNEPVWNESEVPTDESDRKVQYAQAALYYNYFYKTRDFAPYVLDYAKELGYTPEQIKVIKRVPDWKIADHLGRQAKIYYRGWKYTEDEIARQKEHLAALYEEGLAIAEVVEDDSTPKVKNPSVADRTKLNVMNTIALDWDTIVDEWFKGNYDQEFNTYQLFKQYGLKQIAVGYFESLVRLEYDVMKDAYDKVCEQAVEAYEHITRPFQKKMLVLMEGIFKDLESIKASAKQTRIPKAKKPKASDKQIARLKFKVEDVNSKLVSINPVMIPGSNRLYVYNTKNRKFFEYVCTAVGGFVVQGAAVKNFDKELSRCTTLRKPEQVLPDILKKNVKQINSIWESLTTKVSVPNGRITEDCILLRAVK
jgi:hypothetical protein